MLVELFDATGRRVRTLHRGALGGGRHVVPWDGRDAGGAPVGSGVYFLRVRVGTEVLTRRTLVVR